MTRRRRRWLPLAASCLVLLGLLAGGWFPHEPVRRYLESELERRLVDPARGGSVRIGQLQLVPGLLRVELQDVSIETPELRASLAVVEARLATSALLGQASLTSLEIQAPRVEWLGGSGSPASAASSPTPRVTVGRLSVRDGVLRYRAADLGELEVTGIEGQGGIGEDLLEVRASSGVWRASAGQVPLGPLHARLQVSPQLEMRLLALELTTALSRLEASGPLGHLARSPRLDWKARLELAEAAPLTGGFLEGVLEGAGRVSGEASQLRAEAQVQAGQLRLEGWPLQQVEIQLAAGPEHSNGTLAASTLGGGLEASGSVENAQAATEPHFEAQVQAQGVEISRLLAQLGVGPLPVTGELDAELDLTGALAGPLDTRGTARARGRGGDLEIEGRADLAGPLDLRADQTDLAWSLELEAAGRADRPWLREARLGARGVLRGRELGLTAQLDGVATLEVSGQTHEADFRGQLRRDGAGGRLSSELTGSALGGQLRFEGSASDGNLQLELRAEGLQLSELPFHMAGSTGLRVSAVGPWERPNVNAVWEVENASWRGEPLGAATVSFRGTTSSGQLEFAARRLGLSGRGRLEGAGSAATLTTEIDLEQVPLTSLSPLLPEGRRLEGQVSGEVALELPLTEPLQGHAEARIASLELASGPLKLASKGPFLARLDDTGSSIEGLRLEGPGLVLEASGRLSPSHAEAFSGRLSLDLAQLQLPVPADWRLTGQARAQIEDDGAQRRGQLQLENIGIAIPGLPELQAPHGLIELRGQTLETSHLPLEFASGQLDLSASLPIDALLAGDDDTTGAEEPAHLNLSWREVEVGQLLAALGGEAVPADRQVSGSLDGRLELSGTSPSLSRLRGHLETSAAELRSQGVTFQLSPARMALHEGRVHIEQLSLAAEGGVLDLSGEVDLVERELDLEGQGQLKLAALSSLFGEASVGGLGEVSLRVQGPLDAPRPLGRLSIQSGTLRVRDFPQGITGIEGTLLVEGDRVVLESLTGSLGGGRLDFWGSADLEGLGLADLELSLYADDVLMDYPPGMRSRLEADLYLIGAPGDLVLGGNVRASRGLYDLDLVLEESLLARPPTKVTSKLLRDITLDLNLDTENPVGVRGQLAELSVGGSLAVRGDLATPAPFGQLEMAPGGTFRLQAREFTLESGGLLFAGSWAPEVTAQARTELSAEDTRYRIKALAEGSLEELRLGFESRPSLSEAEIISLLVSGREGGQALDEAAWLAGEQAAFLLSSRVSRKLTEGFQKLGIDEVSIQPELIARETSPGARFTFGKRLPYHTRLAYSVPLSDPEGYFIRLDSKPFASLQLLGQRQSDGSLTVGAGQELRFGGVQTPEDDEERTRIEQVVFEGEVSSAEAENLRGSIRAREGRRLDSWDVQEDASRLRERLRDDGHLEAEVSARLEGSRAVFRIQPGPHYDFEVEGLERLPDLEGLLRSALYEEEALESCRTRLLEELQDRGRFRGVVSAHVEEAEGRRRLVFQVEPGPRLSLAEARFPGARVFSRSQLLKLGGGPAAFLQEPGEATERIRQAYADRFHLQAAIAQPAVRVEGGRVFIRLPIDEGPAALLVAVEAEGSRLDHEELLSRTGLELGNAFVEAEVHTATQRLRDHYFSLGHPRVRIAPELRQVGGDLALIFAIDEGERATIGRLEIAGLSRTRESLVRSQLQLEPGDPLDPRELVRGTRRLQRLGIFSRASIARVPDDPQALRVQVEERAPFSTAYQLRYNSESGARGEIHAELGNLLGRGVGLGGRYSRGKDEEEIWGSLFVPAVLGGKLTASVFRLTENSEGIDFETGEPMTIQRRQKGLEVLLVRPLGERSNLLLGYDFRRSSVTQFEPVDVAALNTSLVRNSRDDHLDPRRGSLLSLNLQLAPKLAGSDFDFAKGMAQAFIAVPLGEQLTWAQGYRLGLAHVFSDQPLLFFERFQAGGSYSVRGFARNSLGPLDFLGDPAGGEAVLVLNQELRFHHRSGLGAVAFYDAGNVFVTARDLSLDLRHSLGVGVRYASPLGLLRLDLGWPLARREEEEAYQLSFSIGQAF